MNSAFTQNVTGNDLKLLPENIKLHNLDKPEPNRERYLVESIKPLALKGSDYVY
jgi:hypothetical protein